MSAAPEDHIESMHPATVNDYDRLAEGYTVENETGIQNAYYNGPRSWPSPATWPADGFSTPAAAPARSSPSCVSGVP